jgi:bifunctional DNA-binding transcriptional regulator/antitoxin component of YhaV-PrlF toxin-antitoxin module
MLTMTLTAKRQATLPREVCDELGVHPGDQLDLERAIVNGHPVWVMTPHRLDWSWIGSVSVPDGISHDLDDIRASIERGSAEDRA